MTLVLISSWSSSPPAPVTATVPVSHSCSFSSSVSRWLSLTAKPMRLFSLIWWSIAGRLQEIGLYLSLGGTAPTGWESGWRISKVIGPVPVMRPIGNATLYVKMAPIRPPSCIVPRQRQSDNNRLTQSVVEGTELGLFFFFFVSCNQSFCSPVVNCNFLAYEQTRSL